MKPREVTCTSAGATIFHSEVPATVASFTLSGLKVRDHVYCVVRNRFKRSTVRVVKQWVGDPSLGDDLRRRHRHRALRRLHGRDRERRRAPRSTTRSQPRSGSARRPCRPATRPRSTAAAGPAALHRRTVPGHLARRGRRDRHLHDRQHPESLDRASGQGVGRRTRLGDDLRRPDGAAPFDASTVATADGDSASFTTRSRPRSPSVRSPCRPATAPRSTAAQGPAALYRWPVPGHGAGTSECDAHLHDHEQAAVLDRGGGEAVGRRARVDHDLRRPGRHGPLRRFHRRDSKRRQRLLQVPGVDPGHRRRNPSARGLRRHDLLRRRDSSAVHGRRIRRHVPRGRERNHHVHDHEQAAILDRARRQAVGGRARLDDDLRRPNRRRPLRRRGRQSRRRGQRLLRLPGRDRRVRSARPPCRPATRPRSTAAPARRRIPAGPSRSPPRPGRRHPHLHDHEHAAVLDGARDQALVGRARRDDDLRRPKRRRRPSTPQVVNPANGASTFFEYPLSTAGLRR